MTTETLSWPDRVNPIVLRQLRRLMRSNVFLWSTMIYLAILAGAMICCLLFLGVRPAQTTSTDLWSAAVVGPAQIFIGFAAFAPAIMLASTRGKDELLDQLFSARELLRGYVLLGLILTGFFAALTLPFVSLAYVLGGTLTTMLWGLIGSMIGCVMTNLIFLSFLAKIRETTHLVAMVALLFFFSSAPFFGIMAIEMTIAFRFTFSSLSSTASTTAIAPLTENDLRMIGYIAFLWIVFSIAAYWLCRRSLSVPHRPAWRDITFNLVVYTVISAVTTLIWAALRFGGMIV